MFKANPIPTLSRVFFTIGWIVAILMALAHSSAHFQEPVAKSDPERELFRLMKEVPMSAIQDMTGQDRTIERILNGFSWHYTLSFLMLGVACLGVRVIGPRDSRLFRFSAAAAALFAAGALAEAGVYFFWVPVGFTLLMLVCFVTALLTSKPRVPAST